jgi:hypothetical protein
MSDLDSIHGRTSLGVVDESGTSHFGLKGQKKIDSAW